MTDHIIVLTTYPDRDQALAAAQRMVKARVAACVNVLPAMTSVYVWAEEEQSGEEHMLIIKTRHERYAQLEALIRDGHPYELPEIVATPITHGLPGYLQWIDDQTTP